jgi:uncharacterized protein with NRDE domain
MCLVFIAYEHHAQYSLVVAANRDEFYARPTSPAAFWDDEPSVLAGRDCEAGGTWLGMSRTGRFAALTNFRNPRRRLAKPPSRGTLVTDFLTSDSDGLQYTSGLLERADNYNGFGLLVLGDDGLAYCTNGPSPAQRRLEPGLYGLSNHLLDTPWPKVVQGKQGVQRCLDRGVHVDDLFEVMTSRELSPDNDLPDTGVDIELERNFSAAFVDTEFYGTRSTTVLTISRDGHVGFQERTYCPDKISFTRRDFEFRTHANG